MASESRVPRAIDVLRKHLRETARDEGEARAGEAALLNLLKALQSDPDDEGGEAEAPSEVSRTGYDHRSRVGLDHMALDGRGKRSTPASLSKVLSAAAPRSASEVR